MNYLVLGGGLQGRVVAYDILKFEPGSKVTIADIDEESLKIAKDLISDKNLSVAVCDIFNHKQAVELMEKADVIINGLPHNWETTESFYKAMMVCKNKKAVFTDYWMWDKQYQFSDELKKNNNLVVPGLGIVPGFGNICGGQLALEFERLDEVFIYCGGLPTKRGVAPLDYMVLFNVEALLDLYLTPPTVIEDGVLKVTEPLTDLETVFVPGYGEVKALKTDGLYSLNKTLIEKGVQRAAEFTCRYPGHYEWMQTLDKAGFFSKEAIEVDGQQVVPRAFSEKVLNTLMEKIPGVRDFTYLYVVGRGLKDGVLTEKTYTLLDHSDEEVGITSMMRTTAYPSSIAAMIVAHDINDKYGVIEPESIFVGDMFDKMCTELSKRGLMVYGK